jgi:hypothetical protein
VFHARVGRSPAASDWLHYLAPDVFKAFGGVGQGWGRGELLRVSMQVVCGGEEGLHTVKSYH